MKITLATLPKATPQQVFDQVATHLLTQARRSSINNQCKYRGNADLKCAAGCLMSDFEYHKSFESLSWSRLVSEERVPKTHRDLIRDLQIMHDAAVKDILEWPNNLRKLASHHNLDSNIVTDFQPSFLRKVKEYEDYSGNTAASDSSAGV